MIRYDFAPLEGITTYIFRQVHHEFFPETDNYYMPFLGLNKNLNLKKKELKDVAPENNAEVGIPAIPQVMTCKADQLIWGMKMLSERGYQEVNLNLGCPVGTVTSKGKGSGFLKDPDGMDWFFEETFDLMEKEGIDMKLSVKSRIGFESAEEFPRILEVYNRYPISEVILHPRTRNQLYKGEVHEDIFDYAMENTKHPLVFNGNVLTVEDVRRLEEKYKTPKLAGIMLGRGALRDPALIRECKGGEPLNMQELKAFHDKLFDRYLDYMDTTYPAIQRMLELWIYMSKNPAIFPADMDDEELRAGERAIRKLRKEKTAEGYRSAVNRIFEKIEK